MNYDQCFCLCSEKNGPASTQMEYIGNGKFKCPVCGAVADHHDKIFSMRLEFKKEEKATYVYIHQPYDNRLRKLANEDSRLKMQRRHTELSYLKEDLDSGYGFTYPSSIKDHPLGLFDCDVLYYWHGGMTDCGMEWDMDLFIVSEKPVIDSAQTQLSVKGV